NFGAVDTIVFTYTSWGDPLTVTKFPKPFFMSGYKGSNYSFTYDKKHRLIELIAFETDSTHPSVPEIILRKKFFYDNPGNGNVTRDSTYYMPTMGHHNFRSLTYYFYDKYDRIFKDSTFGPEVLTPLVYSYSYDANGNRTSIKSDNHAGNVYTITYSIYDNNTSILRTNKIWMFLERDYSVNNRFNAVSYNSRGLPTETNHTEFKLCFDTYYDRAQITYGCK
ncbi:MAG TPA: hypothetical protein VI385_07010, partial [Flavisolibacter sp.]